MSTGVVATQMVIMFLFIIIGYTLTKKGKFSGTTASDLSFLIVNICCPAMMLSGVLTSQNMTGKQLVSSVVIIAAVYLFLVLFGIVIGPVLGVAQEKRKYYRLMTVFGNVGFIGYPVINAVIGPQGMAYAALFNLGFNLLFYTFGEATLNRSGSEEQAGLDWRKLINAGTVSGVLAILLLILRPEVPAPVLNCLNYMGSVITFLSVAIIGHNLANVSLKSVFQMDRLYVFIVLRNLVIPILIGVILKRLTDDTLLVNVLLLLLAMPQANMPLMLAQQLGQETETLTRGIVISTVLSIVTITIATTAVNLL